MIAPQSFLAELRYRCPHSATHRDITSLARRETSRSQAIVSSVLKVFKRTGLIDPQRSEMIETLVSASGKV